MNPADDHGSPELLRRIRDEIRAGGPMSFARFMDLALHDPQHGYYAAGPRRLGRAGDFYTASDVSGHFGRCIARHLAELDRALGSPDPFTVIEYGGGRGLLARDVLNPADGPGLAPGRLRYVVVERSRAMREAVARNAPAAEVVAPGPPPAAGSGCVLAVELLDALPVHRLRRRAERIVEVRVDVDENGRLVEREGACEPAALEEAHRWSAPREDGDEVEVCTALARTVATLTDGLRRGFVTIVDYGHDAARLFGPRHRRGTLLAYHRHRTNEDYLRRVGRQDLTAHVNFTALESELAHHGFAVLGRTTQDRFLIANGALEPFEAADDGGWAEPRRVRERLGVRQLIHPLGMGRAFQVLVACRGLDPAPELRGLADPFAR